MLDLELLRNDDCVLVEGATGTLELAAAARVRAYHQNGLARPRSTSSADQADWPSGDDHLECVMTGHLRSDQAPVYD